MNKALVIVFVPALITSFLYLSVGWGFRVAIPVTLGELALAIGTIIYLRRKKAAANPQ